MISAASLREKFREVHGREPEIIARAPGRIEFIGNHTDYNGGTVLGAAIDRAVWVALARRGDGLRRFASDVGERGHAAGDGIVAGVGDPGGRPQRGRPQGSPSHRPPFVQSAGRIEKVTGEDSWVNYPLGMLSALAEAGLRTPLGFDYLAVSDLPVGAGLSSSAAVELASGLAFLEAAGERASREILAAAGRRAENAFVGVPCGILDQSVSAFGRRDHLVFIDCKGPRVEIVPAPSEAHFWIFNTHTKHALVDGLYAERHRECMEAAKFLGVPFLADATPAMLDSARSRGLPEKAFLRASHVVGEIGRVGQCVAALRAGNLPKVGGLLTASHQSSRTLFENSTPELDFLVEALTRTPRVFGARLTGGGFGGAVMALTDARFGEADAGSVAAAYKAKMRTAPAVLHCRTADGAELVT